MKEDPGNPSLCFAQLSYNGRRESLDLHLVCDCVSYNNVVFHHDLFPDNNQLRNACIGHLRHLY